MGWSRRHFLATSSLSAVASLLDVPGALAQAAGAAAQPQAPPNTPPSPPPTAVTPVRGTLSVFTGQGGTIGLHIAPDGIVVVDTQMPPTAKICLEGLRARAGDRRIDYLVNTHHHFDHTAGNGVFRPLAVKHLAHANVPALQKAAAERQPAQPGLPGLAEQVYADRTFTNTWREAVGTEVLALKHYGPAHTGGDAVVTFETANVVHMGDLVFNRRHPFIDRPGGASIRNWITLLETVPKDHERDTIYVFGHAGTAFPVTGGAADLAYMRDYLTALLDHTSAQMKAGKPRDEIVKSTDTLKGFADHGPLIERVLTAAYDELAG
jgi:glyoxylase-like metal-dependent hydrolase (beta-lactamase superfamily II)